MMAMDKPVCLLKDQTLHALQTDLNGRLYRSFSPLDAKVSILPRVVHGLFNDGEFLEARPRGGPTIRPSIWREPLIFLRP